MNVIIAGGGTGGHLFPAVAVGQEMMRERPDTRVLFVGASAGLEAKWLPQSGLRYELFEVHGLRGHSLLERVGAIGEFARATLAARRLLHRERAQLVVSVGGYASAPMAVASILSRVPLVLLEQNTRPGLTNRLFWRFARKVCVGFADVARYFGPAKVSVTGNPVRSNFGSREPSEAGQPVQILVLGGSSGAHRLNLGVLNAFKIWRNNVINLRIVHQTGEADVAMVRDGYDELALEAQATSFIEDVPAALAAASLVIARAGAMTVTEIALSGRPAVFVPYPFHRDLQQVHNARVMERAYAAIIVLDDDHLAQNLARELSALLADRARLREMGRRASAVVEPGAAGRIARICFDIVDPERKAA